MFTIEELKAKHSKVKSGAEYPTYVQEIKKMGVTGYSTYVKDGNTLYEGKNHYQIHSGARYPDLQIVDKSNKDRFLKDLRVHQQGGSDFMTFCRQCAEYGIEKWVVDLSKMNCTYYDRAGNEILIENIPNL